MIQAEKVRVAVIGSREFPQLWMVRGFIDTLNPEQHMVVSGGAQGVDAIAVDHCKYRGIEYHEFIPDYDNFGSLATHMRNDEIIAYCHCLYAFWDGISDGTYSVIEKTKAVGKLHDVFEPFEGTRNEWKLQQRHSLTGSPRYLRTP